MRQSFCVVGAGRAAAVAVLPVLLLLLVSSALLVGCSSQAVVDCVENRECESNSCVAGRCVPLDPVDGGDTTDVLPEGDTPLEDAGDTVGQDVALDPGQDPTDDPGLDIVDVPDDPGLDPVEDVPPDAPPTGPNACGGSQPLLVDGTAALPQQRCGATGSGFLACNGIDGLLCVGEPAPNVCGGAGVLVAEPGDGCGCDGVWTCQAGAVVCVGGADPNACGGCGSLSALPGYACAQPDRTVGAWQCNGSDGLTCGTGNACGGASALQPAGRLPGQTCESACGPGVFVCNGTEALACRPQRPCNACGGSATLAGVEGATCGAFGEGTWRCDGPERVVCQGATVPNPCGGDLPLIGAPGDACGDGGPQVCTNGALECVVLPPPDARNACGGETDLAAQPGTPCGVCGQAQWRCDGRNAVVCPVADELQRNACGGCGVLAGLENAPCGACGDGRLECNEVSSALTCVGAVLTPNACGGCGTLDGSVGGDCGTCGLYACSDATRRLVCAPQPLGTCPVTCDELGPTCTAQSRSCVEASGEAGAECGECLAGFDDNDGVCESPVLAPTNVQATDGTNAAHVRVTWTAVSGASGYHVYRNGTQVTTSPVTGTAYNDTGAPAGIEPAVVNGTAATTDLTSHVQVTWREATVTPGASVSYTVVALSGGRPSAQSASDPGYRAPQPVTRYEVEVRGAWISAGLATSYSDATAPAGTVSVGTPTASTTRLDGIELSVPAATTTNGANQTYRVQAVNASGTSPAGSTAGGRRRVGTPTYQWQRATSSGGSYSNVAGQTTRTFVDTSMAVGEERWYRVVVSATGASSVTSSAAGGRRATTLGVTCTMDSDCSADEWCPTGTAYRRCAPRPELASGVSMRFLYVPAGAYQMGAPPTELGESNAWSPIEVTFTRALYVQRTEVTQGHWVAVTGGANPSCFQTAGATCASGNANSSAPVENLSWWSALGYANALSAATGLPACYTFPSTGCSGMWQNGTLDCGDEATPALTADSVYECMGYRLPTSAEWEYAARAGTTTATYLGDLTGTVTGCGSIQASLDSIAWWCRNAGGRTQAAATRTPNGWGLYDVLGNVAEWTWDFFHSPPWGGTNPSGPVVGGFRVTRGGSHAAVAASARSASRFESRAQNRFSTVGLRLVRTAP